MKLIGGSKKKKHILTFFSSKPKKFKFYYKPRKFYNTDKKNSFLINNQHFGLLNLKSVYLNLEPLLSCIKLIKRLLKTFLLAKTQLHILVFPDFYLTSKPREVRMGKGKGGIGKKILLLRKNTLLFILAPINSFYANYIFFQCKIRFPFHSKILKKT
jgi:large subunit ribosomal protein L16